MVGNCVWVSDLEIWDGTGMGVDLDTDGGLDTDGMGVGLDADGMGRWLGPVDLDVDGDLDMDVDGDLDMDVDGDLDVDGC